MILRTHGKEKLELHVITLANLLWVSKAHSHLSWKDYLLQLGVTLSLKQVLLLFSPNFLSHSKNVHGNCFPIKRTMPHTLKMPLIKKTIDWFFLGNKLGFTLRVEKTIWCKKWRWQCVMRKMFMQLPWQLHVGIQTRNLISLHVPNINHMSCIHSPS